MRTLVTRSRLATAAVLSLGTAAVLLGTGTATAQPAPGVVGMSEQDAVEMLAANDVPYTIVNRSGSVGGDCTVTAQRDRGYRTVVEYEYDSDDNEFDRVERQVWRGVGLAVVCR
ncbi:PASTA domain-containing protein [Rhodococcus pyridinivorans]|uniref:PASTA domain-containing protein n=1 Tax=Rhodococcus pyridinivorans TaxID=103816 RepID=UPI0034306B76